MTDYTPFLERILDILKNDTDIKAKVSEFRLGDLGDNKDSEKNARSYPLVYVTTATNPVVTKKSRYSQGDTNKLPGQVIEYEFWAIIVTDGATPAQAQTQLYKITSLVENSLENNIRLRDPASGDDPLCITTDIFPQRRLEKYRGHLVEAMTVRIRPTLIASY